MINRLIEVSLRNRVLVIAAFLLLDPDFPRSVRHNLASLHVTLERLARLNPGTADTAMRQAGWLAARLEYLPGVEAILDNKEPGLETLLEEVAAVIVRAPGT